MATPRESGTNYAALALTLLTLVGCGGSEQGSGESHTTAAATTAANDTTTQFIGSSRLDGTYTVTVKKNEPTRSAGASPSRWMVTINGGDVALDDHDHIPLNPSELSETRMVVPRDPVCRNTGSPSEGVYKMDLRSNSLRFTSVRDSCADRAFLLTLHTWRRVST